MDFFLLHYQVNVIYKSSLLGSSIDNHVLSVFLVTGNNMPAPS